MFKPHDSNFYYHQVNVPDAICESTLWNGAIVDFNPATRVATPHVAGGKAYVVWNEVDKPELHTREEYRIEAGERARLFDLEQLRGVEFQCSAQAVAEAIKDIAVGDKLGGNAAGKLSKSGDVAGDYFEVIGKDGAFGGRLILIVKAASAQTENEEQSGEGEDQQ